MQVGLEAKVITQILRVGGTSRSQLNIVSDVQRMTYHLLDMNVANVSASVMRGVA